MQALYPGSFDPLTLGHLDVIERAAQLFERVVVAVLRNPSKNPCFSVEQRLAQIGDATAHLPNVQAEAFDGLTVECAQGLGVGVILRGLRAMSDFEYELQIAHMNRRLSPGVETVFLMAGEAYSFISSNLVKEVVSLGGNVDGLVPPLVAERLKRLMAVQK